MVVKARKKAFWSKAQNKKHFLGITVRVFFSPGTDMYAPLPHIWLSFQAVALYLRARGWIWERCPDSKPEELYWQVSERFFLFVFSLLRSHFLPSVAIPWQPAEIRLAQRHCNSDPKHLTLVRIAPLSYAAVSLCFTGLSCSSSLQVLGELSFIFFQLLRSFSRALYIHLCLLTAAGRLCEDNDAALIPHFAPGGEGTCGFCKPTSVLPSSNCL